MTSEAETRPGGHFNPPNVQTKTTPLALCLLSLEGEGKKICIERIIGLRDFNCFALAVNSSFEYFRNVLECVLFSPLSAL